MIVVAAHKIDWLYPRSIIYNQEQDIQFYELCSSGAVSTLFEDGE